MQSVVGERVTVNFEHAGKVLVNVAVAPLEVLEDDSKWISTVEMEPSTYRTTVVQFGHTNQPEQAAYLSDDEIERAIEEIRNAIKKHS